MNSRSVARLVAVLLVSLLAASCRGSSADVSTTTRPPPVDQCEQTAREVVDRLEDFLAQFSDLTPQEFLALDEPEGLDDFQSDVRLIVLDGVVAGCLEEPLTEALDGELERLSGQGTLGDFLGEAIRSGGQAPAQDVLVGPGEDLYTIVGSLGSGSVITLTEGTYNLGATLVLDARLTFVGAGMSDTIIRSTAPDAAMAVLGRGSLAMSDLTFEHAGAFPASLIVAFQGPIDLQRVRVSGAAADEDGDGGSGLVLAPDALEDAELIPIDEAADRDRFVIVDSEFVENDFAGIAVSSAIAPVIERNVLADNGACGICYFEAAAGEFVSNTVERNAFGVQVAGAATPLVDGNTLRDNTSAGLVADGAANPTVTGNAIEGNGAVGVQIQGTAGPTLTDNTIGPHPVAISVIDDATASIRMNTIEGAEVAVRIGGRAAPSLADNVIRNSVLVGLAFDGDATGTFTGNQITGNLATGVLVGSNAAPRLSGNTIEDGDAGALYIDSSGGEFEGNVLRNQQIAVETTGRAAPLIDGNEIIDSGAGGLVFGDGAEGVARGNTIRNPGGIGIQVTGTAMPRLEGNTIDSGAIPVEGDAQRVGILYAGESAGVAIDNDVRNFLVGIQISGSSTPTVEANVIDGGAAVGVGVLYGEEAAGASYANETLNHLVAFQIGGDAAPIVERNTVQSAEVASFLISGSAAGSLDANTCASGVEGIVTTDSAAPVLGSNDCTVFNG